MSAWSNIIILKDDPEIIEIDKIEKKFGELPPDVKKIRELITRFEVCHFKYKKHIEYIKSAIMNLKAGIEIDKDGCDSLSPEIKKTAEKEYLILIKFLESAALEEKPGKDELMKAWLSACFAKTLKEQAKL